MTPYKYPFLDYKGAKKRCQLTSFLNGFSGQKSLGSILKLLQLNLNESAHISFGVTFKFATKSQGSLFYFK